MSTRPTAGWAGLERGALKSRPPSLALLSVLIAGALAASAGEARAGEYRVGSCQADVLNYSTQTFDAFANRGMSIRRACNPEGPGLRGLITRNALAGNRVGRGARAIVTMNAPSGTRFGTFRWAGTVQRRDCAYALQLYADAPDMKPIPIKNLRANQGCPRPGRAQAAGYRSRTFNVAGATRIVQRVICVSTRRQASCSARHNNYIQTYKAAVTITDTSPPAVNVTSDTPLTQGAWVNGTQLLNYDASDNVGVRSARPVFAGAPYENSTMRPCLLADKEDTFANQVPCSNGRGQINVDTTRVAEGTQPLQVHAVDTAGNAAVSMPMTARIDNTPPARVDIGVAGGQGWRNTNDFALLWANPPEGDRAPITAARYRLCAAGNTNCAVSEASGGSISSLPIGVPAPGEWTWSMWRRDAAGNADEHATSVPVTLRYDPEPPVLGFEPTAAANPTQVAVTVTDKVSGLSDGSIELSRQGSGTWQALGTHKDGSRLLAQIDDTALTPGVYALRARARDQAANEGSTDRRLDGQPMLVTLPLRFGTSLRAGFPVTKIVRQRVGRRGHRHWVRRRVTELSSTGRARLGGHLPITGRLIADNGQGIAGASVQVLARTPIRAEGVIATVQTDATGTYRYSTAAASTTTLRLSYAGSPVLLPAQAQVGLVVPATTSLGVRPGRVLNGQSVTFRGRLGALPVPAGGKLVEVQAFVSGRWQTFRTVRTGESGRWTVIYRFQRTRGTQRYRFRARIPDETAYPFATGASRTVSVQVRGR